MSIHPPCIRGLKQFAKKGCPMRPWSPADPGGCPAWVQKDIPDKSGGKAHIAECLDLYMARMAWHTNALLEGNQQAIESFRNNTAASASALYELAANRQPEVKKIGPI